MRHLATLSAVALMVFGGVFTTSRPANAVIEFAYVPAADVRSNNWSDFSDGMWLDLDLGYVTSNDLGGGCMSAPVLLPHGSTVTAFTAWLWDSDSGANFSVRLKRRSSTGGGPANELASLTTSGSSSSIIPYPDFFIDFAEVDSNLFTYFLEMCTWNDPHDHRMYAAQVTYETP